MKKYSNFRKSVITVFAVLLSGIAFSQFTRQQATGLVMDNILGPDTSLVWVYAAFSSHSQHQPVVLFDDRTVSCPYSDNWVFFLDDDNAALWHHPCRFVFVNGQNGDYTIINESMYPVDMETAYELISFVPYNGQITLPDYTGEGAPQEEPSDHLFAVLVGQTGIGNGNVWQWFDISMIYNTLLLKGYKKENIFVLFGYNNGSYGQNHNDDLDDPFYPSDDIDYQATWDSIHLVFMNLAGISNSLPEIPILEHDDQLLIHFDCHGNTYDPENKGSYINLMGEVLYDDTLAKWLEPIDCAQMLITMMVCYSGGFIDDLTDTITYPNTKCKNRQICTASSYYESAHFERHITGGKPILGYEVYGEFVFYFYSALKGIYPDVEIPIEPWITAGCFPIGTFPFDSVPTFYPPPDSITPIHPQDYDPDEMSGNNDGFVQVGEAFTYMDNFNTYSWNGYHNYVYPNTPIEDHPQDTMTGLFDADVLTLTGLRGIVYYDAVGNGNFLLTGDITIEETAEVEIENETEFYFMDENAGINSFGDLIIGSNVLFQCIDDTKQSYINTEPTCNISVGANITLSNMDWVINNSGLNMTINSGIFNHSLLLSNQNSLTLNNCNFNDGDGVEFSLGNLTVSGCHFDGASLKATNGLTGKWVTITSQCQFINAEFGVYLLSYPNFSIQHSTFSSNTTGIELYQSGTGGGRQLLNNTISSNGTGMLVYNSFATLTSRNLVNQGNKIYNNIDGLLIYDNSQVSLTGCAGATSWNGTQYIKDNDNYEVFATQGSFPVPFKYNAIIDEDNTEPMLFYTGQVNESLDVRYNYWGVNIDPQNDFYPWQCYNYLPVWEPGGGGGGSGSGSGAETLYFEAQENIESEEFAEAKEGLEQIVDEYPQTEYAKAAMKELYSIEEYTGDNYTVLMDYYNNNSVIQGDSSLAKLAEFLANFCEIKLENWPTAIAWFEDVILNPETMEDSIFGIIDLGYTYFLMENGGLKSSHTGNLIEHKPVSVEQFEIKRDYLLSLLPGDQLSETMKHSINTLKSGKLLQNVPNPFNGTTQIWYKLDEEALVTIKVFDYTGKLIKSYNQDKMDKGSHFVEFASEGLSAGIYFYSLEVNGQVSDSKKMTVMK
jgi:hypothetical protein